MPALPANQEDAVQRLARISQIFSAVVRETLEADILKVVANDAISSSQFHILRLLDANGPHLIGQIAEFLGISAPAATRNIDKLERLRLLKRGDAPDDRRASRLLLTAKGRKLIERFDARRAELLAPVRDALAPSEIGYLTGLLERFVLATLGQERRMRDYCLRCAAYLESGCPVAKIRGGCVYQAGRGERNAMLREPATMGVGDDDG